MQKAAGEPSTGWRAATTLLWLAFLWAGGTAVYVYAVLGGERLFRLETAAYILVVCTVPFLVARAVSDAIRRHDVTSAWAVAMVAAVTLAWLSVVGRLLQFPLLSEDYGFRVLYAQPSGPFKSGQFFRPVFGLVFAGADALGGRLSPVPLHLTSLVLHITAAALVAVLSYRVVARRDTAVVAFAVFLLNPVQLEAVLWVSGLQELLWTTAVLAALVVYTRHQTLGAGHLALTAVLVAIGLLSKETAVAAALLLPCADVFLFQWRRGRWMVIGYVVYALELVIYLLIRARVVTLDSSFLVAPSRFFFKQMISLPYKTFVQPWNMEAVNVGPTMLCAASLVALSALFLVCVRRRSDRRLLFGPALILLSTLPVYSYFFVDANLMASRYLYFAAAGWAILVADIVGRLAPTRASVAAALLLLIVGDVVSLNLNLRPWRTVGALVIDMRTRFAAGESRDETVSQWQRQLGPSLVVKDGVPISYRGVYVFGNGLPEFEQQSRGQ